MIEPNGHPAGQAPNGGDELLGCLSAEHVALEHLLFKLREQNLILGSGEHRWLARCTEEVEAAVHRLTDIGVRRQEVAAQVHAAHGLPPGATLGELAARLDDEMQCQQVLQMQRTLRDVLDQVRRCSRRNREMLAQGLAATNDALTLLGAVPTYDSAGGVVHHQGTARSFDARV